MTDPHPRLVAEGRRGLRPSAASQHGSVTAETAMVLPVLVAFVMGLIWLVSLGVAQLQVVDAARETARAIARDEAPAVATKLGRRIAPEGADIDVEDRGDTVVVDVSVQVRGPGGLFGFLPGIEVDAQAVTAKEAL